MVSKIDDQALYRLLVRSFLVGLLMPGPREKATAHAGQSERHHQKYEYHSHGTLTTESWPHQRHNLGHLVAYLRTEPGLAVAPVRSSPRRRLRRRDRRRAPTGAVSPDSLSGETGPKGRLPRVRKPAAEWLRRTAPRLRGCPSGCRGRDGDVADPLGCWYRRIGS